MKSNEEEGQQEMEKSGKESFMINWGLTGLHEIWMHKRSLLDKNNSTYGGIGMPLAVGEESELIVEENK